MIALRLHVLGWLLQRVARFAGQLGQRRHTFPRENEQFKALHSQAVDWLAWLEELRREEARLAG